MPTDPTPTTPTEGEPTNAATLLVPNRREPKYHRLTDADKARILDLRFREGLSLEAIAAAVRRSISTVSEYCAQFPDRTAEASAMLRTKAARAVETWDTALDHAALKGDHKAARDLLAAVGVIRDRPDTAIAVQVNIPGAGPLPAFPDLDPDGE